LKHEGDGKSEKAEIDKELIAEEELMIKA